MKHIVTPPFLFMCTYISTYIKQTCLYTDQTESEMSDCKTLEQRFHNYDRSIKYTYKTRKKYISQFTFIQTDCKMYALSVSDHFFN